MRPAPRVLETLSRVAPLGVRFRDELMGTLVGDGLDVSAYPEGQPHLRRRASVSRSGVHVLSDLPGLRSFEIGGAEMGDAAWWAQLPPRQPFTVEVEDSLGRFLPCSFRAELPFRGLFELDEAPPPGSPPTLARPPSVPLFSAPARVTGTPLAVLRAELWDTHARAPAAWARVEVTPEGGPVARGVTDAQGRLALFFQYPAPVDLPPGSFADASTLPSGPPLLEQSWALAVRIHYARRSPVPARPDLRVTLSQPSSWVWPDAGTSLELLEPTLRYGQELVLKTQGAPRSRLWITPTGSPP
ncbi:hypothetical protein KRR26_12660 [Corallococcus sp. M34]|uniref:hypothetical protein n=1 Tax=Citreicoccus inhibens TaxID=2849499 RepID=UPI001C249CEE|nr:hypothetical protein [Citreicoccus inhibens]MBU8896465.1 hypothetical protein [Citreicoccus inhibens]